MAKVKNLPIIPSCESDEKDKYHKFWKNTLREFAKNHLGLESNQFDVRSNLSGCSVGGEITLHTDNVYITVLSSFVNENNNVLYRYCNGRKDYSGGSNHYTSGSKIVNEPEKFTETLKNLRS